MKHSIDELSNKTYQYRKRFLELFTKLGFGHVTSAFSWAEIATVLYHEIMDLPVSINDIEPSDRMVVSKGHGVGILFPIFEDLGYFSKQEMESAISIGGDCSKLKRLYSPGFDFYGGSLGMGLGIATGLAKAFKLSHIDKKIFCIVGDAECYEGSIWEAINFAGFQKLDNLVVIVDRNRLGCSDFTEHMLSFEPLKDKWSAFNWNVQEIDGHNYDEVYDSLKNAKELRNEKPHCIIANTKKGMGLDYLIDKPLMHGYMPKGDDVERAFRELQKLI